MHQKFYLQMQTFEVHLDQFANQDCFEKFFLELAVVFYYLLSEKYWLEENFSFFPNIYAFSDLSIVFLWV